MFKRITLLLTIADGVFTKTRSFNSEHLYTTPHINYSSFDEVILVCTDKKPKPNYYKFIESLIEELSVPLVISGGITTLEDAKLLFDYGADRVVVNRALWENPKCIKEISDIYGKQAVIASLDFISSNGLLTSFDWEKKLMRKKFLPTNFDDILPFIGEVFLQDVDQDGRVIGADVDSIKKVCEFLPNNMPIHIGSCGLVEWEQYIELLKLDYVDAVSVNNVHHMSAEAIRSLRGHCIVEKINIRYHEILQDMPYS